MEIRLRNVKLQFPRYLPPSPFFDTHWPLDEANSMSAILARRLLTMFYALEEQTELIMRLCVLCLGLWPTA